MFLVAHRWQTWVCDRRFDIAGGPANRVGLGVPAPAAYFGQPLRFSQLRFSLAQSFHRNFAVVISRKMPVMRSISPSGV